MKNKIFSRHSGNGSRLQEKLGCNGFRNIHYFAIILILIFSSVGCKKFITIPAPVTSLISSSVFTDNASANKAQLSIYSQFAIGKAYNLSLFQGLSADEFVNYSTSQDNIQLYTNGLLNTNVNTALIWSSSYNYIFQANAVLEGINSSSTLDPKVKQQLKGEAEFTRAFFYFYLVNLFDDVPLILTSNYNETFQTTRAPKEQVYAQIFSDLKEAKTLLSSGFVGVDGITISTERIRPTTWAASALLARAYLYYGNLTNDPANFNNAVTEASLVIANSGQFSLVTDLNKVFKANSLEAIWQISEAPNNPANGARNLILTTIPSNVSLSPQLVNTFEPNDKRKANWVGTYVNGANTYYYPFKYQTVGSASLQEYDMVLRLAEQYLIRAEAEANIGGSNINVAIADLNIIRNRAGLNPYIGATDKASVLTAILHERQVELFTELGHRWLDLKRTNSVDNIMTTAATQKNGSWTTTQKLYPIPQADRIADQNLSQNPGY